MHLRSPFAFWKFLVRRPVPVRVEPTAAAGGEEEQTTQRPSEGPRVVLWQFLDLLFLGLTFVSGDHQRVCVAHGHLRGQSGAGCASGVHGITWKGAGSGRQAQVGGAAPLPPRAAPKPSAEERWPDSPGRDLTQAAEPGGDTGTLPPGLSATILPCVRAPAPSVCQASGQNSRGLTSPSALWPKGVQAPLKVQGRARPSSPEQVCQDTCPTASVIQGESSHRAWPAGPHVTSLLAKTSSAKEPLKETSDEPRPGSRDEGRRRGLARRVSCRPPAHKSVLTCSVKMPSSVFTS